jgi:Zn-dependent protease
MLRRTNSVRLFSVFGIRVGADLSWFIALFLLIYLLSSPFKDTLHSSEAVAYLTTVISVLLLFVSLIVHEFGHALVARRQGIGVDHIDLYLFGGLTRMNRDAATPGEDFKVSAAGPLATLGVILVCLALDLAIVGPHRLTHAIALDQDIRITPVLLSLSWLLPMNVLLLVFNLMPAYPLDGGRIARSIIWRVTGSKRTGTIISARMGQGLSLLLAAFGLWLLFNYGTFAGLWAIALAFMTYQAARSAVYQSALDERIEGVRVLDIMDAHPVAIPIDTGLHQALDEYFLRYGWSWFPATDEHSRYAGIVTQERTQASIDAGEGWLTIASVVDTERTGSWRVGQDRPITDLIGSESLGLLGAVMAVDDDGVLRGVVTVQQLRRAMQSALSPSA